MASIGVTLRQDVTVTRAVIEAVAAREGVAPTDIDEPLYEVIDPDALDNLFTDTTGRVVFEYHGY